MLKQIHHELRRHAPFTMLGAAAGIVVAAAFVYGRVPPGVAEGVFWVLHPSHVLFSAMVTAAMYRIHTKGGVIATIVVGYLGAVGVGTISDCLVPYLGELLLGAGDEHVQAAAHIGFIEMWWLVNPLALLGVALGMVWPRTKLPHFGHVLLSTGASLFHVIMSMEQGLSAWTLAPVGVLLFVAVWLPCCTSDIIFPLLLVGKEARPPRECGQGGGNPNDETGMSNR